MKTKAVMVAAEYGDVFKVVNPIGCYTENTLLVIGESVPDNYGVCSTRYNLIPQSNGIDSVVTLSFLKSNLEDGNLLYIGSLDGDPVKGEEDEV